ncbi:hypothetical protein ACHAWX_006970 [Stephanocyclus meneghinianus]
MSRELFDDVDVSGFPDDVLNDHQKYEHPLVARYATKEMSAIFSPAMKFTTWRKLWLALAAAEKDLGLDISEEQLQQMKDNLYNIDFAKADEFEAKFRHDVMGHVHAFGDVAEKAMPIIHLGATSCYVGDNTDIIQMKEALKLVQSKLVQTLGILKQFAEKHKDVPTLGFTHYQPAQLTTVGKRCTLWMQDLLMDYERVTYELENLPMRGVKGTTGTQATFLELFNGDHDKVKELNVKVCSLMGFDKWVSVSGQTYSRKIDYHVLSVLSGIAQSAYKMCGDIRLLANLKEVEEPFAKNQIGSSAMAYKRNPMRSERVCSLARYVMSLPPSAANTHANQWFERTLDDTVDVILNLLVNIADGMVLWPNVVDKHVREELPFMATESDSMSTFRTVDLALRKGVKAGGDRQVLHEAIRVHSMAAGAVVKGEGKPNDLMERIASDPLFVAVHNKLDQLVDPKLFIGRSKEQVEEFLADDVNPVLEKESEHLDKEVVDGVNV